MSNRLKDAAAGALTDAAAAALGRHDNVRSAEECRDWAEWLTARAATIEADQ